MHIKWLKLALEDIESIAEYISRDNPSAAIKIVQIIHSKVQLLLDTPNIGRSGRVKDTRELIIDQTPFIVPYRIKKGQIEIIRVFHSSRKWPENF